VGALTMNQIASHIVVACWCVFVLVWFIYAFRTKRIVERQNVASMLAHRIPIGLGWWMLLYPKLREPMNLQILPRATLLQITAAAICICGLVFTVWARQTLAGNWSSDVTFKQDHELIRTGPYHIVRHPIYTGLLVMCLGSSILTGQLRGVIGVLLVAVGFWIKLSQEERLMLQHFPDAYPNYKSEVKALVQFVI
jgi:protein-S-isoprenylcysteine O-methyltransferase Ste14